MIELLIVVAIIVIFVAVGIPMFDRYSVQNDVRTKAEEAISLLSSAQTMSASPEQGYTAYRVIRSENAITLEKTSSDQKCEASLAEFEQMEKTNMFDFKLVGWGVNEDFCFETGGDFLYSGITLPETISVSSTQFESMGFDPPTILIKEQSSADTGYKLIFELNE